MLLLRVPRTPGPLLARVGISITPVFALPVFLLSFALELSDSHAGCSIRDHRACCPCVASIGTAREVSQRHHFNFPRLKGQILAIALTSWAFLDRPLRVLLRGAALNRRSLNLNNYIRFLLTRRALDRLVSGCNFPFLYVLYLS